MAMDVINAYRAGSSQEMLAREHAKQLSTEKPVQQPAVEELVSKPMEAEGISETLNYMVNIAKVFDKRLSFSVNDDSKQVVVKVIDKRTDEIIKEIPPEALQDLHRRLKQMIGVFIDESI